MALPEWPRAYDFPRVKGVLKQCNADFIVEEHLPERPDGDGEHLWLFIEKDGQNTAWVARQIAKWAGVKTRDVSYAGLKDRHAITRQTFSVHLPGKATPSPHLINIEGVEVISHARHSRKLKTGQLIGNQFTIRVRNSDEPLETIENRWDKIVAAGVPNYFGEQRFGHGGQNVEKGIEWLCGRMKIPRHQQSIYLSAVRSFYFNNLLANRVKQGNWNTVIENDFVQFTEGKTGFFVGALDEDIETRCKNRVLSPCASLIGKNKESFAGLEDRERSLLVDYAEVIRALEEKGVARQFRKLRVFPESANFSDVEGDPVFSFFLPAGAFATTVLHELIDVQPTEGERDWNE
jgi:tRNA pseudouridine13 synthase